jgi:hypothetical protein
MTLQKINENTSIPLKVVVPIISAIIVVSMWVNTTLNRIEASIHDSWRTRDMQKWSTLLSRENPTIKVPSPYDAIAADFWRRSEPNTASTQ